MSFLEPNVSLSVRLSLTALKAVGFWAPKDLIGFKKIAYNVYGVFSFMFLLGTYVFIQVVDLHVVWGDLPLMTGTAFLLFTNLAQITKIANIVFRRQLVQALVDDADSALRARDHPDDVVIIKRCNRETTLMQLLYLTLTTVTVAGWAASAEPGRLPLRAWYPYATGRSPAYELTYAHQVGALFTAAYANVAKDTLVTALIAQTRCRLELLGRALVHLCRPNDSKKSGRARCVERRLGACVRRHRAALAAARALQACFSAPTFAQFAVSLVIICVTAFQLASDLRPFGINTPNKKLMTNNSRPEEPRPADVHISEEQGTMGTLAFRQLPDNKGNLGLQTTRNNGSNSPSPVACLTTPPLTSTTKTKEVQPI